MSDTPPLPPSSVPLMSPERARDIARGLKWLAGSYAEAGMTQDAARCERDSQWWLAYTAPLAFTGGIRLMRRWPGLHRLLHEPVEAEQRSPWWRRSMRP